MAKFLTVHHPDDDPKVYVQITGPTAWQIQRRFEPRPVVYHPDKDNVFIYDPGNFWDGPTHVTYEPDIGHFVFSGWSGTEHFPAVGPLR